ncbi:hypothetical protein [Cyclonatronum proteinivorum]|uniref:hypothetical protein n=1 Tax=Cyclonatronum proteinivorum TaxID=1457365 RepID=UPI000F52574D|nr:hypothetical protein [Cyclonatronum proteinivorum]
MKRLFPARFRFFVARLVDTGENLTDLPRFFGFELPVGFRNLVADIGQHASLIDFNKLPDIVFQDGPCPVFSGDT